jgi:hypothetical protein
MMCAYLRDASLEPSSDFALVTTIFPNTKIRAVVLGSWILMMTAAKTLAKWTNVGTVCTPQSKHGTNLGVVFHIPGMQHYGLQVESAIQIHSGDTKVDLMGGQCKRHG